MRFAKHACLLLALLSTTGCMTPLRAFEQVLTDAGIAQFSEPSMDGRAVRIEGNGVGCGAVIAPNRVLTVAHVVGSLTEVNVSTTRSGGWVRGRVTKRIPARPEAMVVIELDVDDGIYGLLLGFTGFGDCYRPGAGEPQDVQTQRGLYAWRDGVLRPGDSGSPVLDDRGNLAGLVSGRRGSTPVCVSLYGNLPEATRFEDARPSDLLTR